MQRLAHGSARRLAHGGTRERTHGVPEDRGSVSVVVGLATAVLMAFAAVVVDVGALYAERRELQNGADAAALAVARDCALSKVKGRPCVATSVNIDTARTLMDANAKDGAANVDDVDIQQAEAEGRDIFAVTVKGSTENSDGADAISHTFASIVGVDESTVTAQATAVWGSPAKGPAPLPLALPTCAFQTPTNPPTEIAIPYKDIAKAGGCKDRNGFAMPGNFGWLKTPDDGECAVVVDTAAAQTFGQPGNSFPKKECEDDLAGMHNAVIMLPVYDVSGGRGSSGWYQPYGFAAFRLTGYNFTSGLSWNSTTAPALKSFGIKGYFTKFVSLDHFTLGGVDLGFSAIELVE